MRKLISCKFNMDTACVELRYTDGTLTPYTCSTIRSWVIARFHVFSYIFMKVHKTK